jgi:hypothetical protein
MDSRLEELQEKKATADYADYADCNLSMFAASAKSA